MSSQKQKSQKRFEQLNRITDTIAPTLHTPGQVAVLMVCFRHAYVRGSFQVSTRRIAASTNLSSRQAGRILDELTDMGIIELECEHKGPVPRRYRITGRTANDDAHVTNADP